MIDQDRPNVAKDLLRIHAVISRGVEVADRNYHNLLTQEKDIPAGLLDYIQTLTVILKAHHELEDELVFPHFRNLLKEMPFEELTEDHKKIHAEVGTIRDSLEKLRKDNGDKNSREAIAGALDRIKDIWHPHIRIEETHASVDALEKMIPQEEHLKLSVQYAHHGMERALPPYFTVPFLLYNLEPLSRKQMAKPMPKILTLFIVPVLWRRKWIKMKPYFLP
jgi:hemerythrin-like domain-containing protein